MGVDSLISVVVGGVVYVVYVETGRFCIVGSKWSMGGAVGVDLFEEA